MRPFDLRLLRRARTARWWVVASALLTVAAAGLVIVQALLIAWLVAGLVDGTLGLGNLPRGLGLLALVGLGRVGVSWAQERFAHRAAASTIGDLREQLVVSAVSQGPRGAAASDRAGLATLATRGLDALEPYFTRCIPAVLATALITPAVIVTLFALDWVSGLIALVTVPLVPVFMWLVGSLTKGITERRLATVERLGSQVLDLLAGLPTLRAFGREIGPGRRVRELGLAAKSATMKTLRVAFLSSMVLELLATLSVAVIAVSVGLRMVDGGLSLRIGLAAIMLAPEAYAPLRAVASHFHSATDGLAAFASAESIIAAAPPAPAGNFALPAARQSAVAFNNVSIRAGDRDVLAPANLSARFPLTGGNIVALAGPSGSGKTTAIEALLGLLSPTSGAVDFEYTVGSQVPTTGADLESWWSQVTWVPQRPSIAPGTLRSLVGEQGDEAARLTGLDQVISTLPQGWDTPVGQGGLGLSVGQRQRLALTMALAADSGRSVVVLDEPTAHLDAVGEQVILNSLSALRDAGRTVIVVAHRDSVIALADQVIEVHSEGVTA